MYSELDVHIETYTDPLYEALDHERNKPGTEGYFVIEVIAQASHPTTVFHITQHDGRRFKTTIVTEEI